MYAYLDSSNDVVGLSTVARTLEEAQAVNPDIATVIDGAPAELGIKDHPKCVIYHRKTSGDGTDISHYTEFENLDDYKVARLVTIDMRTRELITEGFEYPDSSGDFYSLSMEAQASFTFTYAARADATTISYPVKINLLSGMGTPLSLADAAAVEAFYKKGLQTVQGHKDSGTTLRDSVLAATTCEEVDAVVDNR